MTAMIINGTPGRPMSDFSMETPQLDRPTPKLVRPWSEEEMSLRSFRSHLGNTPMVRIEAEIAGKKRVLVLKLESSNPCGSIKDRTCWSLINSYGIERLQREHSVLVES